MKLVGDSVEPERFRAMQTAGQPWRIQSVRNKEGDDGAVSRLGSVVAVDEDDPRRALGRGEAAMGGCQRASTATWAGSTAIGDGGRRRRGPRRGRMRGTAGVLAPLCVSSWRREVRSRRSRGGRRVRIGLGFSTGGDKWRPGWALGWLGCAGMGRPVFKEKKGFPSIGRVEIILLKKRECRNPARVAFFCSTWCGDCIIGGGKGWGKVPCSFFNVDGS